MRIVNVRIDSRNQIMELKATENNICFSVTDYISHELKKVIKEQKESPSLNQTTFINISVETGGEF